LSSADRIVAPVLDVGDLVLQVRRGSRMLRGELDDRRLVSGVRVAEGAHRGCRSGRERRGCHDQGQDDELGGEEFAHGG
jgi:hypothetical protein